MRYVLLSFCHSRIRGGAINIRRRVVDGGRFRCLNAGVTCSETGQEKQEQPMQPTRLREKSGSSYPTSARQTSTRSMHPLPHPTTQESRNAPEHLLKQFVWTRSQPRCPLPPGSSRSWPRSWQPILATDPEPSTQSEHHAVISQ